MYIRPPIHTIVSAAEIVPGQHNRIARRVPILSSPAGHMAVSRCRDRVLYDHCIADGIPRRRFGIGAHHTMASYVQPVDGQRIIGRRVAQRRYARIINKLCRQRISCIVCDIRILELVAVKIYLCRSYRRSRRCRRVGSQSVLIIARRLHGVRNIIVGQCQWRR